MIVTGLVTKDHITISQMDLFLVLHDKTVVHFKGDPYYHLPNHVHETRSWLAMDWVATIMPPNARCQVHMLIVPDCRRVYVNNGTPKWDWTACGQDCDYWINQSKLSFDSMVSAWEYIIKNYV